MLAKTDRAKFSNHWIVFILDLSCLRVNSVASGTFWFVDWTTIQYQRLLLRNLEALVLIGIVKWPTYHHMFLVSCHVWKYVNMVKNFFSCLFLLLLREVSLSHYHIPWRFLLFLAPPQKRYLSFLVKRSFLIHLLLFLLIASTASCRAIVSNFVERAVEKRHFFVRHKRLSFGLHYWLFEVLPVSVISIFVLFARTGLQSHIQIVFARLKTVAFGSWWNHSATHCCVSRQYATFTRQINGSRICKCHIKQLLSIHRSSGCYVRKPLWWIVTQQNRWRGVPVRHRVCERLRILYGFVLPVLLARFCGQIAIVALTVTNTILDWKRDLWSLVTSSASFLAYTVLFCVFEHFINRIPEIFAMLMQLFEIRRQLDVIYVDVLRVEIANPSKDAHWLGQYKLQLLLPL